AGQGSQHVNSLYAARSGNGFFGGVGKNAAAVVTSPIAAASGIFAEATEHYTAQGIKDDPVPGDAAFSSPNITYSAFYASGIEKDKNIKITLDKAACCDAPIQWKASLPITVSYM
ncbi:hypothetical protein QUQ66_004468, partial [Escherichia coli]|nr:hypothetical protein [Escherichia coli]